MLLPNLIPLIDVTFSTPTGDYTQVPSLGHDECNGDLARTDIQVTVFLTARDEALQQPKKCFQRWIVLIQLEEQKP
jgi:hypothetical protein